MENTFSPIRKVIITSLISVLALMVLVRVKPDWLLDLLTEMLSVPLLFIWGGSQVLLLVVVLQRIKRAELVAPVLLVNHQVEPQPNEHPLQQIAELFQEGNEARLHAHVKALYLKQYCSRHQLNSRDALVQISQDQHLSSELRQALLFKVKPNWKQTISLGHWPISSGAYLPSAKTILAALKPSTELP